jgi:hypothetical protein
MPKLTPDEIEDVLIRAGGPRMSDVRVVAEGTG